MYGILITFGAILALLISEKLITKKGMSVPLFWQASFWTILFGIIGARLYHVIDYWEIYSKNLPLIFAIWNGGLGIFGALLGGFLAFYIFVTNKKQKALPWLDVIAIPLPLAQAIGRWGNYFNGELIPYALYESGANILLFVGLLVINKRTQKPGLAFIAYLIGYSSIRLLLEPLRTNSWEIAGLNVAQGISILLLVVSIYLLNKWKKEK